MDRYMYEHMPWDLVRGISNLFPNLIQVAIESEQRERRDKRLIFEIKENNKNNNNSKKREV